MTALACLLAAGAAAGPANAAGATADDRAYGKLCQNQSPKQVRACVAAMARLARAQTRSTKTACRNLDRRRAGGARTSPFQKCVAAGRRLVRHGNGADRAYLEAMIPHHVAGVEMAELALSRTQQPFVRTLALSIVASQNAEIARMRSMVARLRGAGIAAVSLGLSKAQMGMDHDTSHLHTAEPFDVAFVDHMIPHHQGALTMNGVILRRGVSTAVRRLAEHITEAQSREIRQMRDFRDATTASGGEHTHSGLDPHPHA